MKTRDTKKRQRRIAFRGWRRHIGASERVQFEEGRKKFTFSGLQEEAPSLPAVSQRPNPSHLPKATCVY